MPSALTLGGLLVALALHADAAPPNPLYTATVKLPAAEARSGPSDDAKMYPTNRLRQGDKVEVVRERDDGWLEIKPPSGSFSWINTRFLERRNQYIWVVHGDPDAPVPVLVGSTLIEAKPTVSNTKVRPGSQVVAMYEAKAAEDGLWLPIEPPPGEVRYLRADAVARDRPPESAAPSPPTPGGTATDAQPAPATGTGRFSIPPAAVPTAAPVPPPAGGGSSDPRWLEAQRLEQEGKTAEAAEKYRQLGQQVCSENHDLAMQCFNRAYFLRDAAQGGAASAGQAIDARYGAAAGDGRLHPVPAGSSGPPPQTQQANYQARPDPAAVGPLLRSDPGQLRVAGRGVDGKQTYVLISGQGQLLMYITAQPGLDLGPYLDRNVQVTGPLVYRMDLRAYHMSAQQVTPVP
jgi:hypothetical protein